MSEQAMKEAALALDALAEELAVERALHPQRGDTTDEPALDFAALRPSLPLRPPRPRWVWGVAPMLAAAAAVAGLLWLRPPLRDPGLKGAEQSCGEVVLELAEVGPGGARPLASRRLAQGVELWARERGSVECASALLDVRPAQREVRPLVWPRLRPAGEEPLLGGAAGGTLSLEPGRHLLVLLATPHPVPVDKEQVLATLAVVGAGAACTLDQQGCALDVIELEVE